MSDHEEAAAEPKAPKKSRLGLVLATVVVVVLVTGAAVAGTLFGPALLGHKQVKSDAAEQADDEGDDDAAPPAKKKKKGEEEGKIGESVELNPILVDARAKDGELHHLKVVLAIEVAEGTPKDEFMRYSPRGREAAVAYLRSQGFDDLASPVKYNDIRSDLGKVFSEAVGEKRVARVMVIDYVAQ